MKEQTVDDIIKFVRFLPNQERTELKSVLLLTSTCSSFILDRIIWKATKQLVSEVILVAFMLYFEVSHSYQKRLKLATSFQREYLLGKTYQKCFILGSVWTHDFGVVRQNGRKSPRYLQIIWAPVEWNHKQEYLCSGQCRLF